MNTTVSARAVLLVCLSAILWGLYWLPVMAMNKLGVNGVWAALFISVAGLLASLPMFIKSVASGITVQHLAGALGIGAAFTLYGSALAYTDIVRVVLLFYLAPAWSILIEHGFFGRTWSIRSAVALILSFLGLLVIFRGELPLGGLGAIGDWMAIGAGISWSVGAALMFSAPRIPVVKMTSYCLLGAIFVAVACLLLLGGPKDVLQINGLQPWLVVAGVSAVFGLLYIFPVTCLTLWGTMQLPPALMSFLLTLEVIAAVASSAWLLDISFGWMEALGTALIISAALTEFVRVR